MIITDLSDFTLVHYTKTVEALFSILKNGFYYSFCPTEVFDQLFVDAELDVEEPTDHPMVCFTELSVEEFGTSRSSFGDFGVAISREWAKANGARKVEYLERYGPRYKELLEKLKRSAPAYLFEGKQPISRLERSILQCTMGNPQSAKTFGADAEYIRVLEELMWVQIDSDNLQAEWRFRNPNSTHGTQHRYKEPTKRDAKLGRINRNPQYSTSEMIQIVSNNEELRRICFLSVPRKAIFHLIAPLPEIVNIQAKFRNTEFSDIRIIPLGG